MKIDRTLFWFKDGDTILLQLNEDFFGIGTLLNRLLNEKYNGKKIKFVNLDFATEETYKRHPILPRGESYCYGGHLRYHGVFDRKEFERLTKAEQTKYLWDNACSYLKKCALDIKNNELFEAVEYAYKKGLEINLNPDYRMVDTRVDYSGQEFRASVWVNFKADGMYSTFTLERGRLRGF